MVDTDGVREGDSPAVGTGFDLTFDEEIGDVLRYARYAHAKPKPTGLKWVRVRGRIIHAERRQDKRVLLVLNKPWPTTGSILLWLSPNMGNRIADPADFVVGLIVEATGFAYSRDGGKTIEIEILARDQLSFLVDPTPDLPALGEIEVLGGDPADPVEG